MYHIICDIVEITTAKPEPNDVFECVNIVKDDTEDFIWEFLKSA